VEQNYLADYGMTFDQVLTYNSFEFDNVDAVYDYAHESTLGNLFSDAYRNAASEALGYPVDVALTASGVIRESISIGPVTASDIFNAASLGVGTEGELVEVWLTGADLKCALEVDASVYPLMHSAQLFYSGVEYSFNTNRKTYAGR
jgi:2',3'-cyclic-nucleotide 2'-phosphodiesterase (5'-nucleotidase family)